MPIVEGRYETRLSTTFSTVDEGIEEIKRMIQKSRAIRISSLPMKLLKEIEPLLVDKDLKIILPLGEKPTEDLKRLGEIATTKARIYVNFKGTEANTDSIIFSTVVFNVVWLGGEIFDVSTMEYGTCVKCLRKTFDMGWRYSQKW